MVSQFCFYSGLNTCIISFWRLFSTQVHLWVMRFSVVSKWKYFCSFNTSLIQIIKYFRGAQKGYRRVSAARDFFVAFSNRTMAYELDHVIGIVCFSSSINETLEPCQKLEQFKVIIINYENKLLWSRAILALTVQFSKCLFIGCPW